MTALSYREFLEAKVAAAPAQGFDVPRAALSRHVTSREFAFQGDIIQWALRRGSSGIFTKFGLGKTFMGLELARLTLKYERIPGLDQTLIVAPLGVRPFFFRDAATLGTRIKFVQSDAEMKAAGVYLTNYESVRDRKITSQRLKAIVLDEGSILRSLGSETFRALYDEFSQVPHKHVLTATPSPNEYIELLNYAMFLGVMDIGEAKTRFFRRNSEKADALTLHPHKRDEFMDWLYTWSTWVQSPSDLGYPDDRYRLPKLSVNWHVVGVDHSTAGEERDGQQRLIHDAALGLQEAAAAKRDSLDERITKVKALLDTHPRQHAIVWHDLEAERQLIERELPDVVTVYGSQDLEDREQLVIDFADGRIRRLAAKPVMLGSGCNLQRFCHWAIFAGVGYKFNDFIQAIHRIYRFLQTHEVTIDIVFSEAEAEIVKELKRKWKEYDELMAEMSARTRHYGLTGAIEVERQLRRSIGCVRREERGPMWEVVNNDTVEETAGMPDGSVDGMILSSWPFSTQYEYTPSYNDFGHTDNKRHFFRQMSYLTPEQYRVLAPGRVMCIHVKDRVRPGGYDGRSFQSVDPFHADVIKHCMRHGFVYMGMITIATDVVRENNQTNRLGWSEQCKDGSRMSVGLPEYVLIFRKPPSDNTKGYADVPVAKTKDEYKRGRWQIEAHAFWKSNGNRLITPDDFVGYGWDVVFNRFKAMTIALPYDHERVVAIAEAMDEAEHLPHDMMLLQPHTDHPDIWTDVTRMRGLNSRQVQRNREMHLCPLPFDIVERLINRFTNPGELVFDPFNGIGTVTYVATEMGRRGRGHELNPEYFADSVFYLRQADEKRSLPTLFDLVEQEPAA